MIRTRLALVAVVAALALVIAAAAQATTPPLVATVGPGFTITLTQLGKKVTKLKAGTYTIKVSDKSSIHNFHLTGPGRVNKTTSVSATVASSTWIVKLVKGTYKYVCDPHASIMKGSFIVS
jgi:plastocyanin